VNRLQTHGICSFLLAGSLWAAEDPEQALGMDVLADRLIGMGAGLVSNVSGGAVQLDEALLRSPEMKEMYRRLYGALQEVDMDRLAELAPLLFRAIPLLERIPGGQGYADWLRQRFDYAELARRVVIAYPLNPPPKPKRPNLPPVPVPQTPRVQAQRNRVSSDVDVWQRKLEKRPSSAGATQLLPQVKSIFAAQGLPAELAWLAEVESSFNPKARSPVGAVGLYQFMPTTAESLGLALKPKDEREDPARSAEAAAVYLRRLHGRFDSWPLALAAYNAGEGRVNKLLRRHKATDFEGIREHLPSETRMYVPKLDAVLRIREGKTLASLKGPT